MSLVTLVDRNQHTRHGLESPGRTKRARIDRLAGDELDVVRAQLARDREDGRLERERACGLDGGFCLRREDGEVDAAHRVLVRGTVNAELGRDLVGPLRV